MNVIYIAGPFSAMPTDPDPFHACNAHIMAASRLALACWRAGWAVICPHKNTQGYQHVPDIPPEVWYQGDLEILRRCNAILMMNGWEASRGATLERDEARKIGIPIYYEADGIPVPPERRHKPIPPGDTTVADITKHTLRLK